jgi:acetyl esterase/lipase
VFAGDSAGGGLCITILTILRDMGLPMPAGAVLISPWVDLTHSFPSIVQNTDTVRLHHTISIRFSNSLVGYHPTTWVPRQTIYIVAYGSATP